VYGRQVGDQVLSFGVSGMLWRSALVMYDRETDTLWSHFTGEALRGPLAIETTRLRNLASVPKVRWGTWRKQYPETKVLSVDGATFHKEDVYADYHKAPDKLGVRPVDFTDTRLPAKALVVGCMPKLGTAGAVPHAAFPTAGAWVPPDGDWLVYRDPATHTTSAFATRTSEGRVSFATGFNAGVRPTDLTESTWDMVHGVALDGPRKGQELRRIPHLNVYWFAWLDYHHHTELILPDTSPEA
jgi:hypothetical protein